MIYCVLSLSSLFIVINLIGWMTSNDRIVCYNYCPRRDCVFYLTLSCVFANQSSSYKVKCWWCNAIILRQFNLDISRIWPFIQQRKKEQQIIRRDLLVHWKPSNVICICTKIDCLECECVKKLCIWTFWLQWFFTRKPYNNNKKRVVKEK